MHGPSFPADPRSPLPPERPAAADPVPATERDRAGAHGAGDTRDPFFDNAKYLAIVLVAAAHAWEPFRDGSRAATALYLFVYTFHMPAFIVVSGYFSRDFDLGPRRVRRLIAGILVPYLVFEVAYAWFRRWADGDPDYPVNVVDPQFLNWFLLALFLWRLTAPLWRAVRWPVPIAVAAAVLSSVTPGIGPDLDLQRVLQFLPFFVLGLGLRPDHFARLRRPRVRAAALALGAGALGFAYWAAPRLDWQWLYHRESAQELGVPPLVGAAMSLALLGCSLALTACFLAWVPRRRMWCTALGAGTLYGYLLHGFAVKGAVYRGWYAHAWLHTPAGMVAVTLLAAVLVTLLCTGPVRRALRWAVEPRLEWLFRPRPAAGDAAPGGTPGATPVGMHGAPYDPPRAERPRGPDPGRTGPRG
ncbi:acyltransferase family protein [Streptomyces sp. JJ36]|uniref:acyltransferase family protein n=1 Tax=Streptomyces sp. JJ36 TaxID=2736645 RepID=UPI001F032B2A|nr:acyltransferase family protein [Streptomyces sp. JJ36]MCF6526241.1 acyltransferase family protein [Streptomyces sp. JJ36]